MEVLSAPLANKAALTVLVLASLLPFGITFGATFLVNGHVAWKVPLIILGLTLPVTVLLLGQLYFARLDVSDVTLSIGGGLYKEKVLLTEIRKSDIAKIDLTRYPALPGVRVNGIGLPGFCLGWYQPYKSRKLFVFLTSNDAVLIPTAGSFDVLVSPRDADNLISVLTNKPGVESRDFGK